MTKKKEHRMLKDKKPRKPHLCKTCGETDKKKFGGQRKSTCTKCYNKKRSEQELKPPTMTPGEQHALANKKVVSERIKELRSYYL